MFMSVVFCCSYNFLLFYLGFSLHLVLGFIFVVETSVSGDSTPFSLVPDLDLSSAFPLLTSFGWLMLFLAGSADGFGPHGVLTPVIRVCKSHEIYDSSCISFTFQITICGPLERTELFIWLISYFVLVTCTVFICVLVYCRRVHSFSVF
jgi:hypothetical protein